MEKWRNGLTEGWSNEEVEVVRGGRVEKNRRIEGWRDRDGETEGWRNRKKRFRRPEVCDGGGRGLYLCRQKLLV